MPKGHGTYYIADAGKLAEAILPTAGTSSSLESARKANKATHEETVIIWIPARAATRTVEVQTVESITEEWSP